MEPWIGAMPDNVSDRELVERVQRGERKAFDLLVLKYQHRIAKLIARYVHEPRPKSSMLHKKRSSRLIGRNSEISWRQRVLHLDVPRLRSIRQRTTWRPRRVDPGSPESTSRMPNNSTVSTDLRELGHAGRARPYRGNTAQAVIAAIEALPEDLKVAISLRELEGTELRRHSTGHGMPHRNGPIEDIFRAREAINARLEPLLD